MCLNLADSKFLILVAKSLVVKFSLEKVNRNPAAGNLTILANNPANPGNPGSRRSSWKKLTDPPYHYFRYNTCTVPMAIHSTWSSEPPIHLRLRASLTCWFYHVKMTISHGKTPLRHRLTMPAIHSTTYGRRHRTRSNTITLSPISIPNDFATRISTKKTPNFKFHWQKVI